MSDKNFKVKNKLVIAGLTNASGVLLSEGHTVDSHSNLATQYGGTGTTTSPNAGQVLYSESGATYAPTNLTSLPGLFARGNTASRPASPIAGDIYANTETGFIELYTGSTFGWEQVGATASIVTSVTATNTPSSRAFNNGAASIAFTPGTVLGRTYTVTSSPGSYTASGSSSPITITGLQSSTQYTYTVVAANNYGTAAASSASTAVPATTVPQAPSISSVTGGNAQVSVAFTANATGGSAITGFTVTSSPGGLTTSGASSPLVVTGLTNGTAYTFNVTATNANGISAASSASSAVTPVSLPEVSGGTLFSDATFYYRTFTGSGNLTVASGPVTADILVVAGGGGGNQGAGGGGGAGGLLTFTSQSLSTNTYQVVVGGGGNAGTIANAAASTNGVDSRFGALTLVKGGGRGAYAGSNGFDGGSGGGGGGYASNTSGGNPTSGQGNAGGNGDADAQPGSGGGGAGGGAGAAGTNAQSISFGAGANGGNGLTSSFINTIGLATSSGQLSGGNYYFAGGGAGPGYGNGTPLGSGGLGGGGFGSADSTAGSGTTNTGGGGGGGFYSASSNGGPGGSGLIVIRYTRSQVGG